MPPDVPASDDRVAGYTSLMHRIGDAAEPVHRVLVLGAGHVAGPLVRHYLGREDCRLTVVSLALDEARALVADHPRGRAVAADASEARALDPLVADADLVVSLLPYTFHVAVAELALHHRVPLVTTSYVSPGMRALDAKARAAGVVLLNEVGLDPGIDHMSAMRLIDRARAEGARVLSFTSCCGGLPAPEAAEEPWRYKFSWSPRGVLLAWMQPARFREGGRVVEVEAGALGEHVRPYDVEGLGRFEVYPNRDSLQYAETYGLGDAETILRGTIRYPGWAETLGALASLGWLDATERRWHEHATWAGFPSGFVPSRGAVRERLEWAGLLSDAPIGRAQGAPLDVLAERLAQRLAYREGERDMVLLRHELIVRRNEGDERWVSTLVAYGEPGGDSAMARTVALPAAIAGELVLAGQVAPGVRIPTSAPLYRPILERLARLGIGLTESKAPLR